MVDRRSENSKVLEESKRLTLTKNVGSTPTSSTRRMKMKNRLDDVKSLVTCWLIAVIVIGVLLTIGILAAYFLAGVL